MAYISRTEPHRMFREVSSSALITKEPSRQYTQITQKKGLTNCESREDQDDASRRDRAVAE
jgi:hypothetical protein